NNEVQTPAGNPRLYQLEVAIEASNQTKLIESITVEKVSGGFINVMGVSADVVPTCPSPTNITATTTAEGATVTWIAPPTIPDGGYDYYYSTDGIAPDENTTPEGNTSDTSLELPGLDTGVTYYCWLRSNYDTSNIGYWQMVTFTTGQLTVTYSDGDLPTMQNTSPTTSSTDFCIPEPTMTIEIPTGYQIAAANVSYSMTAYNGAYMSEQRSYIYCPTLGVGETTLFGGTGNGGTFNYNRSINFANGATGTIEFVLRAWRTWTSFGESTDCTTYNNKVDDGTWSITITYEPIPDCPAPIALTADVTGFNEAILSWMSDGTAFDIEYGETGFTPTGTPSDGHTGVSNNYTLTGLEADTNYEYYVRQDCGEDETSEWVGAYSFYTGYCTPTSTNTYVGYVIMAFSTTDGYIIISNAYNGLVAGYSDFTNHAVTLPAGSTFYFDITVPTY